MRKELLKTCLLFGVILAIALSCSNNNSGRKIKFSVSQQPLKIKSEPVLLIFDSTDFYGEQCRYQTEMAMRYAKIEYKKHDISRKFSLPTLDNFPAVVTVTENLWKLDEKDCAKLKDYVFSGGGLAVLYRAWNNDLIDLFGIKNRHEPAFVDEEQSMSFEVPFLPGGENLIFDKEDISNFAFRVSDKAKIIARTQKSPIVWMHKFGKGKVIYWNTGVLSRKINRGFIVRSIAAVKPYTVAGLINVAIFDLDDFPNASYNVKLEPIKSEFDMTISEFYVLRWYPDLIKLAKEYGLRYTSALIFNYNGRIKPPFKFFEWLNGKVSLGGKTMAAAPFAARNLTSITELGLHGYNHQSLSMKIWKDRQNMKLALEAAKKRWKIENLGELPQSYVPPLNIYDSTGVNVLHQVLPSIQQIGALYLGKFEMGQFREFGPEPWNKDLYVIPRNTSGYILTDFFRRSMISLLNCNGVWSHFIHPDDVYPTGERYSQEELKHEKIAALSWYGKPRNDGLYFQLKRWLDFARKNYPYLRYMKRKHALPIFKMYDKMQFGADCNKNVINLETNITPSYFAVFLSDKNELAGTLGCELVYEHKTNFGSHLIIKVTKHVALLQFKNPIFEQGD